MDHLSTFKSSTPSYLETGRFLSHDGHPIYYEIHGSGEPLILIYGLGCLINHWNHQIAHFRHTHQVIVFDLRGHHKSIYENEAPSSVPIYDIHQCAEDVYALKKHLNLENPILIAHSLGAPIALETIHLYPKDFGGFISINGFFKNPLKKMFGIDIVEPFFRYMKAQHRKDPISFENIWKKTLSNPITLLATTLFGGFNFKLTHFKDMEIYGQGLSMISIAVFSDLLESAISFDGSNALKNMPFLCVIVGGEKDHVTPVYIQKEMASLCPKGSLHVIPYGSHCTQLDFPEYVNLIIERYIQE